MLQPIRYLLDRPLCFRLERQLAGSDFHRRINRALQGTHNNDADNPDITDYYGHKDLTAVYKWRGHSFTLMGRGNLAEQKGALRVSWMSPPVLGPLRGYLVGFIGYGDTLLDYNFKQNAASVGLALNDVLDR